MLEISEGREVRLPMIAARKKRTRRKVDECVKVRASSQVGVTERLVLVPSPAACVLFSAEYQVFCTKQVQNTLFFSLQLTFSLTLNSYRRLLAVKQTSPFLIFAV